MELLVMIDAFRRASARTIAAVIPYFGYARQDRKARGRDPITAKLVANLITVAGITRIITLDLHAEQIQGFFDIPVDNLLSVPVFASHFQKNGIYHTDELVVVSPDIGGVKRASRFAEKLGLPLAIMDKRRPKDNIAEVVRLIGDVADKTALVFDDIIDTGRSLAEAAKLIREKGAKRIIACSTHGVFSGDAVELIQNTPEIEAVMATNSIQQKTLPEKFQIISVAKLLGEAIMRVRKNLSVSILFR
jgi:ribose-phosphate pyrophosphokinase